MRNSRDAGLPQQEPESSCIQEARAVELHPTGRLVVGESPGQKGGVGFRVDQREARAADGAAVGFRAEVHKYTGVAKGNVERRPHIEPCESYRKGCTEVRQGKEKEHFTDCSCVWHIYLCVFYICVYQLFQLCCKPSDTVPRGSVSGSIYCSD